MKASKVVPLTFSYSHEELIESSIQKEGFLRRDQVELQSRGITVKKIDDLVAQRVALMAMPPYPVENRDHTLAIRACEAKRSTLAEKIIEIQDIAANTFTKKGTKYFAFNVLGINKLSEEALIEVVPVFVKAGTDNLVPMGVKGLTAGMLTTVTTLAADLVTLLQAPPLLLSDSNAATINRHECENALYEEMRSMSQTGHIFFKKTDKVKAKDYVMDTRIPKVTNRKGIVKGNTAVTRKTDNIIARTRIRAKVSTGISIEMYFGITKTTMPTAKALIVENNPNIFVTTTTADLGYDLEGGVIHLIIRNLNNKDAKFLIKIG